MMILLRLIMLGIFGVTLCIFINSIAEFVEWLKEYRNGRDTGRNA